LTYTVVSAVNLLVLIIRLIKG